MDDTVDTIKDDEKWKELLRHNVRIQDVFERVAIGDDLKILSPYFEVMTVISAAKNLKGAASYYFLSMYLATIGIDKDKSKDQSCGFMGKSINLLIENVTLLLTSMRSTDTSTSEKMILNKIVKSIAILSIAAGKVLSAQMEKTEKNEKKNEISRIYIESLVLLLASSDVLKKMFKEILSVANADEKSATTGSEILFLFATLVACFTLAKKMKGFEPLFDLLNPYLQKSLLKIEDVSSNELAAVVNQGLQHLKNENYEDFIKTIGNGLEALGIIKSELEQDLIEIEKTVDHVHNTISTGLTDFLQSNTEMVVVA